LGVIDLGNWKKADTFLLKHFDELNQTLIDAGWYFVLHCKNHRWETTESRPGPGQFIE
jgi:hypothetical protein